MKSRILALSVSSLLVFGLHSSIQACGTGGTITNVFGLGGSTIHIAALGPEGEVTGFSYLPGNTAAHAFVSKQGLVMDLGTLGGVVSKGVAFGPSGAVIGESTLPGETKTHAALFRDGAVVDLGTLGGSYSTAVDINALNQVVGSSLTSGDYEYEAFVWSEGNIRSLGSLAGYGSYATALNDAGWIIGDSYTEFYDLRAFLYVDGVMQELGTLGGWDSSAAAINNAGVVVGDSMTADFEYHAFLWDGTMQDLGTLGGNYSSAIAVNEMGVVLGESCLVDNGPKRGFVYTGGEMVDLGTLGGSFAAPSAINNAGKVVGTSATAEGAAHAFLWQNGTMTDLNSLLPANSGWELQNAIYINDDGQIVGIGLWQGQPSYFHLNPTGTANQPPTAVLPASYVSQCGGVQLDASGSSDPDNDALTFSWVWNGTVIGTSASLDTVFPPGTHQVSVQVSDPCGDSSIASTTVLVADTLAPQVSSASASNPVLEPPNNQLVPVAVTVSAQDNCDATVASRIVAVECNAAIAPADAQITGDLAVLLRASKNPDGQERIYFVKVATVDAAGNTTMSTVEVRVPKNKNGGKPR